MANTYTQLYIHIVFAVKGRENLIFKTHKEELHKYIAGIIQNKSCKLMAVHCMPDHCHLLVSMRPDLPLSDLVRDIKASSSKFINEQKWFGGKFQWQEGFGAFSYGQSQVQNVIRYIQNQKEHHQKRTFREEYQDFLHKFQIDFKEEYLFE
jgi:REP element-mobilizing transposase RayT